MPADRTDVPENRRGRHQSRAPALQDIDPGSRSASATPGPASNYNQRLDPPAASTEQLPPAASFDPTCPGGSGHGSVTGNTNSHLNVLNGPGNIINSNPIMNFESSPGAFVNYATFNATVNNFMVPDNNTPNLAHEKERVLKDVMNLIGDRFISDALYDTQPKHAGCMSGTRESVLERLFLWIRADPTRIFWLAGMAGTGKTSVAVTLCRMLCSNDSAVVLGGSFFCSRSAGSIDRTKVRHILPTLVATLASQHPEFSVALAAGLRADPRVVLKPVSDQIEVLLIKPFDDLAPLADPIIFIIDGLDECSDEREVAELLTIIADLETNLNVKFVVTSRPEMHIRGTPISNPDHNTILQLHTIKEEEVTIDIRRYVTGTLEAATTTATSASWFTNSDIEMLVQLSNGLFIFASTVLRYVLAREQVVGRKERLHKVMYAATHGSAVTTSLDKIYEMIVLEAARSDSVDADELRATQRVLASILSARTSLSVLAVADLLKTNVGDIRGSLERLHSVVYMPDDDAVPGVRSLHASFGDYVVWRAADHVRLPTTLGDEVLARGCLNLMLKCLRFNVSQSDDSYKPRPQTKPHTISLSLEYACLQWVFHVSGIPESAERDQLIHEVFRPRFLFWLEVVVILGKVRRAAAMLFVAATTVRVTALAHFLRDANRFVASSQEALEYNAPHIYLSALPFAAKNSLIYRTFAPLFTGLLCVEANGVDQHGGRLMMTLTGHGRGVTSVDCSSDGLFVISGSDDGTVRIWGIGTGEETMPPLNCGGDPISSVAFAPNGKIFAASTKRGGVFIWSLFSTHASLRWQYPSAESLSSLTFSPDGSLVASGLSTGVVRIWQVQTGEIFATIRCDGLENISTFLSIDPIMVYTVAFSPDGTKLASMSGYPITIQLWLVATGEPLINSFLGDRISSNIMCFSPDATILAIPSSGGGIEMRKIDNWMITATISYAMGSLRRILFSPDGQSIAAASDNGSLYLFTIPVEGAESPPVVVSGHAGPVTSATFSHDGLYIISSSYDCTIRIWDTGGSLEAVQTLSGHNDCISSVTTASDGTFIVSGSHDRSVRVWNAHTGTSLLAPLLGHTDAVLSVAVSQDSRMIASGSADAAVRLWDSRDGRAIGEPLTGHGRAVNSVEFSPDTLWLASGSEDRTVRIWDVAIERQADSSQLNCSDAVRTVAFSPDGRLITAGEKCGRIHIWRTGTWQFFCASLQNVDKDLHSIAFTSDSTRIISGGHLGRIAIWNVTTRQELFALRSTSGWVNSVIVSHDGTLICSGSSVDRFVRIRNITTGKDIIKVQGHINGVNSLALKPDGRSLVSCSDDQTIRVWDLTAARQRPSRNHINPAHVLASATLSNGWLASSSENLLLWVPREYRRHLSIWPCTMLIGKQCVNITAVDGIWHHGASWTSCWHENAWKAIS